MQVRRLARQHGLVLTHSHLLANSLAKLARGMERLGAEVAGAPVLSLFAGRRSSSRRFLLLQNWWVLVAWGRASAKADARSSRPARQG
jgi:hypothetical protein